MKTHKFFIYFYFIEQFDKLPFKEAIYDMMDAEIIVWNQK